jgi:hypothetical protein
LLWRAISSDPWEVALLSFFTFVMKIFGFPSKQHQPWLGERGALWLSHDGFSAAFGLEFSIPQYPQEKPGMRTVRTPAELLWA